jgi:phage-related protein
MQLKRRVALDGVWLDEVDRRIVISGVEPGDGKESISAVDAAAGYGQRVTGSRRSTLDIVVKFKLLQRSRSEGNMAERAQLLEAVNAWAAGGGVLTVNYKPNRRLNVVLAQAPGEGSLWDYTKEFQITFRAYAVPYWEDEAESSQTIGGSSLSKSGSIQVGGSVPTQADVEIVNTSGKTINNVTVSVAGKSMTLNSLGLAGSETLVIDHKDGLVRIRIRSGSSYRSVMAKRTDASADDFVAEPGTKTISYSAQRACRMIVTWRNRYL